METSTENSVTSQFPLVDMVLFFHSCTCYNSIKSFFLRYWSFRPSHGSSKTSSCDHSNQKKFECPSKDLILSTDKKEDVERVYRRDVEQLMGNMGLFCSQESDEPNESFGFDELSRLFEEEPSLEELKQAFDVFDVNKDGFIDAEELQRVLCILGLKQNSKLDSCNKMIRRFDEDGDGRINFQEFVKIMENSFS